MDMSHDALKDRERPWYRRPSAVLAAVAGLLAADLLRRTVPLWTVATFASIAVLTLVAIRVRLRAARRSIPVAILLPIASRPLCDREVVRPTRRGSLMRHPVMLFALFLFLLFLLPVLLSRLP